MPNIPKHNSAKIVLRVRPSRKGSYVRECRRRGVSLAAFIQAECDRASGYTEESGKLRGEDTNPDNHH